MRDQLQSFILSLALCHTALASQDSSGSHTEYSSPSPDEEALVQAARHLGVEFQSKDPITGQLTLYNRINECEISFKLLHVLEFDADRKRMSVIVRDNDT